MDCPFYMKKLSILTSNKNKGEMVKMHKDDLAEFILESDYCPELINGLCDNCGLCEISDKD